MRAVVCEELGPPESLRVVEREPSELGSSQMRVSVAAAGVNFVDGLFVQGLYQIKPPLPFVPGSEIAGTVTEVGDSVDGWTVGDRAVASVGLGGFASEVVVSPGQAVKLPDGIDFARAATFGQSYCTAWFSLTRRISLQEGESLLVLGASGGVGLASIDVGLALGATVIAAASSSERLDACASMGAHHLIDYHAEALKDRARELAGGGVDVVVDPVGGTFSEQALRATGHNGRLLVIGFASGDIPRLPTNQVLLRNRQVIGVDWGAWALAHPDENGLLLAELLDRVATGGLHPVAPTSYPLDRAGQALRDLLDRKISGKVALTIGQ